MGGLRGLREVGEVILNEGISGAWGKFTRIGIFLGGGGKMGREGLELVTERLVLREMGEWDYEAVREIDGDAETQRYEHEVYSEVETRARLERFVRERVEEPREHYHFAITLRGEERMRGWIVLGLNQREIREYEIGWAVRRADWGKGYASEAARRVLEFAFGRLRAHRVVAFCHAGNAASARVMVKLGMQHEGTLRETRWLRGQWWDELVYAVVEGNGGRGNS